MKKETKEEFCWKALHKMCELAGHDKEILKEEKYFQNYSITEEQHLLWKIWFYHEAGKTLRISKTRSVREFEWFDLMWGLKIQNNDKKGKE